MRLRSFTFFRSMAIALSVVVALAAFVERAEADIQIDLNDFDADPTVTVLIDGSAATIAEDSQVSPVLLVNDPFFGDPNVIIPAADRSLTFDYVFSEGSILDDDEFGAFVFDSDTGLSSGTAFEFFTSDTGSGSVSIDLTSLVGMSLGLQFQLSSLPGDRGFDSQVVISNVQLVDGGINPLPEPASLFVWGGIVLACSSLGVRRSRRDS